MHADKNRTALTKFGSQSNFNGINEIRRSPALAAARRIGDISLNSRGSFDEVFIPTAFRRVTAWIYRESDIDLVR